MRRAGLWVLALCLLLPACSRPLPEENSRAAALYRARCGSCHAPFQPELLTDAMWRAMVERMEKGEMRRAGLGLEPAERRELLAYLVRNAARR